MVLIRGSREYYKGWGYEANKKSLALNGGIREHDRIG